jgi:hypothetical protein
MIIYLFILFILLLLLLLFNNMIFGKWGQEWRGSWSPKNILGSKDLWDFYLFIYLFIYGLYKTLLGPKP